MLPRAWWLDANRPLSALIIILLLLFNSHSVLAVEQKRLQLEVVLNDVPAKMITSFVQFADGGLGTTQSELEELGILTGIRRPAEELVMLREISKLNYRYDERNQKIYITIDSRLHKGRIFDLRPDSDGAPPVQTGWGAVLNYDLLSTSANLTSIRSSVFTGSSLSLAGRAFSPYGTLEQSSIARLSHDSQADLARLDTTYRYADQARLLSVKAGDTINSGLAWSRPIRIGGLQAQSNFALRPDLITMPLPTLSGSAAVPSTVDVYVNNIKTSSQDVGVGPFTLSNVPVITGAGNAQLVIRDSAGRETRMTLPFYASASLLSPETMSWSVEAGYPRHNYGSPTDSYVATPVATATLRRGIFDWLTLEGHAEVGSGLSNAGAGATVRTGTFGVAAGAISASNLSNKSGFQSYASYETSFFGLNISASSQRTFGQYEDLASVTARPQDETTPLRKISFGLFSYLSPMLASEASKSFSSHAPKALDRLTVGASVPFDVKASWSLSLVHLKDTSTNLSTVVSGSYSRAMHSRASLFATVFTDISERRNTGGIVGLSFPIGESVSATAGASTGKGGTTAYLDAVKPLGPQIGNVGWRVRDAEGAANYREMSASYRSSFGTAQVGINQVKSTTNGMLELRGSLATIGGRAFLSDWIDDGFAVVDTGAPDVAVFYDNRPTGKTGRDGTLLIPNVAPYHKNKISVDPSTLPVDAAIDKTRQIVAPAERAGMVLDFRVHTDADAALVIFVQPDGNVVPAGAVGHLTQGEEFVVGYDGQAFIRGLRSNNEALIEYMDKSCRTQFPFVPRPGEQVRLDRVLCR